MHLSKQLWKLMWHLSSVGSSKQQVCPTYAHLREQKHRKKTRAWQYKKLVERYERYSNNNNKCIILIRRSLLLMLSACQTLGVTSAHATAT